ncbi:hypothetical protein O6H91_16G048200 [Diphasiastrum complanatum]|uniref:Uncharacterized protein n=1 Tax=Diphasiastrum complanatum TaxID=34168 RepID=A0ACC2BC28_DIPCM|nr:hypothetical protein O6H91_16G048200 [Diphasiastrum complanatum]
MDAFLLKTQTGLQRLQEVKKCFGWSNTVANLSVAIVDGLISATAFFQLLRLRSHNRQVHWTRQMVFHFLIGSANFGYSLYMVLNLVAACQGWVCWPNACGFIFMAMPQIVFLSTFLLLLSFWVDLCHQATDKEDEEEDEDDDYRILHISQLENFSKSSNHMEKQRKCCCFWRKPRIRSRQKFVIAVVIIISVVTVVFALLIWVGKGDNHIDSPTVAQVYSDLFAIVILLSGGGLAGYGLLLYSKLSRCRSGKTSTDIRKVAGLAVASVVCFSVQSLLVFFTDIPQVFTIWSSPQAACHILRLLTFLYYFIGEAIPSVVVLWVMKDVPARSTDSSGHLNFPSFNEGYESLEPDQALLEEWLVPEDDESLIVVPRSWSSEDAKFEVSLTL